MTSAYGDGMRRFNPAHEAGEAILRPDAPRWKDLPPWTPERQAVLQDYLLEHGLERGRAALWTAPGHKVPSSANMRENRWARAKRVKAQRAVGALAASQLRRVFDPVREVLKTMPEARFVVACCFWRLGPKRLDDDNLAASFKAYRDGIAEWVGLDDGDPRWLWSYAQRRNGPGAYGLEVAVDLNFTAGGYKRDLEWAADDFIGTLLRARSKVEDPEA